MPSRNIKILLSAAIIAGGVGFLLFSSLQAETTVYKYVNEVMAAPDPLVGQRVKVHGYVEAGSVRKRLANHEQTTEFVLEREGVQLAVTTTEPPPDTFKDLAEVVAVGLLNQRTDGSYQLVADEIQAKCPSKYEENQRTKNLAGPG